MRERDIEGRLIKAVKEAGGVCPKFIAPGFDGMPDRIVMLPEGHIGFVEVKTKGKQPRPLQRKRHEMLRALGFLVFILDDPVQIPTILEEVSRWQT